MVKPRETARAGWLLAHNWRAPGWQTSGLRAGRRYSQGWKDSPRGARNSYSSEAPTDAKARSVLTVTQIGSQDCLAPDHGYAAEERCRSHSVTGCNCKRIANKRVATGRYGTV